MLQVPVSDKQTEPEASRSEVEREPERLKKLTGWGGRHHPVAGMQQAFGNQAALRMLRGQQQRSPVTSPVKGGILQRKCACGNSAGSSGSCTECQNKQEGILQTKLQISEPGDRYEQEADLVADRVMRMPEPTIQPDVELEKDGIVHTQVLAHLITPLQHHSTDRDRLPEVPPIVNEVLGSPGQELESNARKFMESHFRHDFSNVRVHADAKAAESAKSVNALAYTVGKNIAFGAGQYKPRTPGGQRLIAHELAHTVQQHTEDSTTPNHRSLDYADRQYEQEAENAASAVMNGQSATVSRLQTLKLARQDMDAGVSENLPHDAGIPLPGGIEDSPTLPDSSSAEELLEGVQQQRICGPDITTSLTTMLGTVEPWFRGLTGFEQSMSCMALGPGAPLVGVNPIMAWDTRELFLPNTGWLDPYFRSRSCGSPRDAGCATDPTRNLCETAGSCGNSVVVGSKCMLAGTANYALFGKMCRLCHDYTGRWNRWDMRAIIGAYKTVAGDDATPPKEMASAAYDGTFPTVPAAAENRGTCTSRCGQTHSGAFNFIWEPYRPR